MTNRIAPNHIDVCSLKDMDQEQFLQGYFFGSRPLVIRGALKHWPALERWGADYFRELYRDRRFEVGCNNRAVYGRLAEAAGAAVQRESENLSCDEAMDKILSKESGRSYYLQKQSIPDLFPELMEDLTIPPWIPKPLLTDINLWYGGGGNVTPLHFDFSNNFLAQVSGVKHFTLIAPEYFQQCYPAESSNLAHLSRVDLEQPDLERFPNFRSVELWKAAIHPGDLLYMPPFWWHFVTLDEPSISVNFWWRSHIRQCCYPAAMSRLPGAFVRGVLPQAFQQLDLSGFKSLFEVAQFYVDRGAKAAGILIAAAGLERKALDEGILVSKTDSPVEWQERWSRLESAARPSGLPSGDVFWQSTILTALEKGDDGLQEEVCRDFIDSLSHVAFAS